MPQLLAMKFIPRIHALAHRNNVANEIRLEPVKENGSWWVHGTPFAVSPDKMMVEHALQREKAASMHLGNAATEGADSFALSQRQPTFTTFGQSAFSFQSFMRAPSLIMEKS